MTGGGLTPEVLARIRRQLPYGMPSRDEVAALLDALAQQATALATAREGAEAMRRKRAHGVSLMIESWCQWAYESADPGVASDGGLSTLEDLRDALESLGLLRKVHPEKSLWALSDKAVRFLRAPDDETSMAILDEPTPEVKTDV